MDTLQWVHGGEQYTDQVTRESSELALSLDRISVSTECAVHVDVVYHLVIGVSVTMLFRWRREESMSVLLAPLIPQSMQPSNLKYWVSSL